MRLADFKLERYFARWEFAVPHNLGASDIAGPNLAELLTLASEEDRDRWQHLHLGYTESAGHPLLRAEIAGLYTGVSPDEVLISSPEEAIFLFLNTVLGPEDHAVVIWPVYQSHVEVARSTGAAVSLVPLRAETGWQLDLAELRAALRPTTRAIMVNFPHNPTGALLDRATFAGLVALATEHGAYLFSDEVYRDLEQAPAERLPAAVECYPRAVSFGALSKSYGLAGLRIGWVATHDHALLDRLQRLKDYTTICNSAPSELLALIALRAGTQILARNRAIITINLGHLDRFMAEWSTHYAWVRPRGGSVGFPRLLAEYPIDRFAQELVEQAGILIVPGSVFDYPDNHFRIGFGRPDLPTALAHFARWSSRLAP